MRPRAGRPVLDATPSCSARPTASPTCWSTTCGLVPGNRVLLRAANKPMLVACWFAVMKAGGIAVATMPLLRAKELTQIIEKAEVSHALCDARLRGELETRCRRRRRCAHRLLRRRTRHDGLEARMARKPSPFANVDTAADDTCLLAFTSGTTGQPKATMHFHRDVMASCVCFPRTCCAPTANDVFIGSPPLAFTFGLGGLLLFPMGVGASTVLLEKADAGRAARRRSRASRDRAVHRADLVPRDGGGAASGDRVRDGGTLRKCVSAGEALPAATRALWQRGDRHRADRRHRRDRDAAHLHLRRRGATRPGATGKAVPGYRACVVDDERPRAAARHGRPLAVKGPTGCRYLADPRQASYVQRRLEPTPATPT